MRVESFGIRSAVIMVAVFTLIATAMVMIQLQRAEAFPGANGKIVYEQSGTLYTMNPDGSGMSLLRAQGIDPAWSADGTKVAFTDTSTGDFNIWTVNADGSGSTQVSSGDSDFDPAWSPDGEWIAFRRVVELSFAAGTATATDPTGVTLTDTTAGAFDDVAVGDTVTNVTTDESATVTAKAATTLTMAGLPSGWTAGNAYTVTKEQQRLFKIKTDGTMETALSAATATDRYNDYAPDWSPDSTQIAYATNRNGADDVYVMLAAGEGAGAPTNLTASILDVAWDPSWSPDGTAIAFASADDDDGGSTPENIWKMDSDGSNKVILTQVDTAKDEHPSWSPDGTSIVFERETGGNVSIHVVTTDGATHTEIAAAPPSRTEPHWQPTLGGVADAYGLSEGATAIVNAATGVLANDLALVSNVGTMTAVKDSDPAHGSLTFNADGSFTYVHDGSETTTDSFTYHPVQGGFAGATTTVTFTIAPVNDTPVAGNDGPFAVQTGGTKSLVAPGVLANDTDDGALTAVKVSNPAHGSVTLNANGSFTYTHNGDAATSDSFTYQAKDASGVLSNVATVSFTISAAPVTGHLTGLVDTSQGQWHLYDDTGKLETSFYFGNPGDYPFMGDWDGDGVETPGLYRQSDGYVYLRNSNTAGPGEIKFFFGNPGDVPIAGDFNNDGKDTVSIYRPSNQTFYIINKLGSNDGGLGAAETSYVFGNPGDKPFVGDFDGDGVETVGLHRESTGLVYFRNSHTQGIADKQFIFGDPGDRLVAGDWNNNGEFSPALFRPSNVTMYFRYTNTQGNADNQFIPSGSQSPWLPVSGQR